MVHLAFRLRAPVARFVLPIAIATVAVFAASPAAASAALSWSGALAVNPSTVTTPPNSLPAVACPSASQCTAISLNGAEITFNPTAVGTPTPVTIDPAAYDLGIACPSTTQCTVINENGQQLTFNPTAPGTPTPVTIGSFLRAVTCWSTSQCTAVNATGDQITFNPSATTLPPAVLIDSGNEPTAVTCESATQCTAVDDFSQQVTFNPNGTGTPNVTTINSASRIYYMWAVACPSVTECVGVGRPDIGVEFDPTASGSSTATGVGTPTGIGEMDAVTCLSMTHCVAVDDLGNALEGDPADLAAWTVAPITGAPPLDGLACGSAALCVAVDTNGNAYVGTGPAPPAVTLMVSRAGTGGGSVTGNGISCPSTCSASYAPGTTVTLVATPASGSAFSGWSGGGCSGTAACTVTMNSTQTVTATFAAASMSSSAGDTVSVGHVIVHGTKASLIISCRGRGGSTCTAYLKLTVIETLSGGKVIAVSARARTTRRTVIVGAKTATLAAATSETARLNLNAVGQRLLKARHKLSVRLTVTTHDANGTAVVVFGRTVVFRATTRRPGA